MNGQTGYLNSRLKNLQNKRRCEEGTSDALIGKKMKVTCEDYPEENETENECNVEEDLLFLRSAVTPKQIEEIKFKLRSTLRRRIELTSNKPSVHLRSNFPFFFSDPTLVNSLLFNRTIQNEVLLNRRFRYHLTTSYVIHNLRKICNK